MKSEQLANVTVESTKEAANQYLGPNYIQLVLLPEKKQ